MVFTLGTRSVLDQQVGKGIYKLGFRIERVWTNILII